MLLQSIHKFSIQRFLSIELFTARSRSGVVYVVATIVAYVVTVVADIGVAVMDVIVVINAVALVA